MINALKISWIVKLFKESETSTKNHRRYEHEYVSENILNNKKIIFNFLENRPPTCIARSY